jgi:ribosomal-protein-alanine N-acetyltransferase
MDSLSFRQLNLDDTDEYFDVFDANRSHFDQHDPLLSDSFKTIGSVAEQLSPWNARHRQHFGVFDDDALIGSTALFMRKDSSAEIAYWLDQEYTGRGIGGIACTMTINHGIQTLGRRKFEANILPTNHASIRTVQKLGFQHVATYERDLVYELDVNR